MNDIDPMDLSPLGPEGSRHWQSILDGTAGDIDTVLEARHRHRNDAIVVIAGWRRPLLAAAAAVLAVLVPAEMALEAREARQDSIQLLAASSATWVASRQAPSGSEILRVIAGSGR